MLEQKHGVPIEKLKVHAFKIPTELPESDGTLEWDSTILILVELYAGNKKGLGYTYGDLAVAKLITEKLQPIVEGTDAFCITHIWQSMVQSIRNLGRAGIASMAISAVDVALWDLKAQLLNLPLIKLLNAARFHVPIYGSGGFTSFSNTQLQKQFGEWLDQGITRFKMKVGRNPKQDIARVKSAREVIGPDNELFVDANGGYTRKQALYYAQAFADFGVTWFEEPVSSDDLAGLNLIRNRAPVGMDIAAGEYGYDLFYFRQMLASKAVDVLQADATRCGGYTNFLAAGALTYSFSLELSAHTAPQLHSHICCAINSLRHLEYFADHVRIEQMLFDGVLTPIKGGLQPDFSRMGLGLEFRMKDAAKYAL